MTTQTEIEIANKTSRNTRAVGSKAIVPRYIRQLLQSGDFGASTTVLDFGAGKTAAHMVSLLELGYNISAFEFGDNFNENIHDCKALSKRYDIVYASNVLNTQSSRTMIKDTLNQIKNVVKFSGSFFCNYPQQPRKCDIGVNEMKCFLFSYFKTVVRVGGTSSAPLFECR